MNKSSFIFYSIVYLQPAVVTWLEYCRYGSNTKQSIDQLQPGIRTNLKTVTAHKQNEKWSTPSDSLFMSVLCVERTTGEESFNISN